jgi:hypothetical protein
MENNPYQQGWDDYSKGKEFAPANMNKEDKIEWHAGWYDAQCAEYPDDEEEECD